MSEGKVDLSRFHHHDKKNNPVSVFDYEIFRYLCEKLNIFVFGDIPYIYDHGVFRPDLNGTRLKTEIRDLIYPELIKSYTTDRIYKLFIDANELRVTEEDLNAYPPQWINFRNGFYDPISEELKPHSPSYRAINQIPHEFSYQKTTGTLIDDWLNFIAEDPDDKEMLLQYCGLCMNRDVRQQKFMILSGSGGTGKSTLIKILEEIIGRENISNISLKELSQRFASYGLMGQLLNSCADLEVTALEDASLLKKIIGEDAIRAEAKGKNAVFFRSYAKLIFSTNELPTILSEKSNGFYRRLLILKMNKTPAVIKPDYLSLLLREQDHFIQICLHALHRMYEAGTICESQNSKEAVESMRCDSDSVQAWLHDDCELDPTAKIERPFLFERYEKYCDRSGRKALTKRVFYKSLELKGFKLKKNGIGSFYFAGILPSNSPHVID